MELKAPCLIPSRPLLFTLPLLGLPPPFVLHLAHMGCRPLSSYYTWHIEHITPFVLLHLAHRKDHPTTSRVAAPFRPTTPGTQQSCTWHIHMAHSIPTPGTYTWHIAILYLVYSRVAAPFRPTTPGT